MKSASAKAKGRRLQQRVAADIVRTFLLQPGDATSRSSGATGTDVLLSPAAQAVFPFAVECKNVERVNVWDAMAQSEANSDGHLPLVVLSRNAVKEPLAVVRWVDLLSLVAAR